MSRRGSVDLNHFSAFPRVIEEDAIKDAMVFFQSLGYFLSQIRKAEANFFD
jgi:hypothetical protein